MNRRTTARVALLGIAAAAVAGGVWTAVAGGAPGTGATCLAGTWLVDPEHVRESALMSAELAGVVDPDVVVEGNELRTFGDGAYTGEYDRQMVTVSLDMSPSVAGTVARLDGVLTGSYEVTGTEVTVYDLDASGVAYHLAMTMNGEEFDTGDLGAAAMGGLVADTVFAYRCSGDTLVLTPVVDGVPQPALAIEHTRR